ncbi:hypothetical protein [Arsenicicoccus dermatophilus]|uniref:hypothetical protein n=1 Tax=Arsenicicoccus dermatophilus TaxID=1076331 RepID=UPI001F4CCC14|nr:hypothetical protein [Arsenicicoccus dermatophilus]MCH8613623.1 hypothetical protein [Arsenicicoccus dermatophilus]
MPVLSLTLVAIAALAWRSWAPVALTLLAAAGSLAMTVVGKSTVGRVRLPLADAVPPYEHSPSFPSGRTLNTTVIIGVLTYLLLTHPRHHRSRTTATATAALWIVLDGALAGLPGAPLVDRRGQWWAARAGLGSRPGGLPPPLAHPCASPLSTQRAVIHLIG